MTTVTPSCIVRLNADNLEHLYNQDDDVEVTTEQVDSAAEVVWRVLHQNRCRTHGASDTGLWRLFREQFDNIEHALCRSLFNAAIARLQIAGQLLVDVSKYLDDSGALVNGMVIYRIGHAGSSSSTRRDKRRPRGRR